jgi:hypothetical protein
MDPVVELVFGDRAESAAGGPVPAVTQATLVEAAEVVESEGVAAERLQAAPGRGEVPRSRAPRPRRPRGRRSGGGAASGLCTADTSAVLPYLGPPRPGSCSGPRHERRRLMSDGRYGSRGSRRRVQAGDVARFAKANAIARRCIACSRSVSSCRTRSVTASSSLSISSLIWRLLVRCPEGHGQLCDRVPCWPQPSRGGTQGGYCR